MGIRRAAAALGLVVASCASPTRVPPTAAVPTQAGPPALPEISISDGFERHDRELWKTTLTVVDLGSLPRRALVYAPAPGATLRYQIHVDRSSLLPRYTATVLFEVLSLEDGWILYRSTLESLEHEPRPDDKMPADWVRSIFDQMEGAVTIGEHGVHGEFGPSYSVRRVSIAKRFDGFILAGFPGPQLPVDPVGVGARWTLRIDEGGDDADVLEYQLTAIEGDSITVEATVTGIGRGVSATSKVSTTTDLSRLIYTSSRDGTMELDATDTHPATTVTDHIQVKTLEP